MGRYLYCVVFTLFSVVEGLDNGLGLTPPLAYSSFNFFADKTNETIILEIAQSLHDTGLADLGYKTVNIDAGYLHYARNNITHKLQVNEEKFPHGLRWLSDKVHSMGLKLGVYTDLSNHTCGSGPGSYGHYDIDAETFATDWQVDYLKVDYCGHGRTIPIDAKTQYAAWKALGDALNKTGRPIYYSICPHTMACSNASECVNHDSVSSQWEGMIYAPQPEWNKEERHALANSILVEYENTFDAWYHPPVPRKDVPEPYAAGPYGITTNIDSMVELTKLAYSGAGSWNDADMMQLCTYGKGGTTGIGMTLAEYRAHYSVWSILASPLILSADLRTIKEDHPDCLALMLNKDIVAVNQDKAALAPRVVYQKKNATTLTTATITQQAFARPLSGSRLAVLLLNRDETEATMTITWKELGLKAGDTMNVYDVITQAPATGKSAAATDRFTVKVATHDVSFIILSHA